MAVMELYIKNPNIVLFSLHLNVLNLSENIGISLTSKNESRRDKAGQNHIVLSNEENIALESVKWIKLTIRIALAGVGSPIKLDDCLVSTLNFASLNAENSTITKGINDMRKGADESVERPLSPVRNISYLFSARTAGTIPKLIKSAKESSSLPIGEYALSNLAKKPSRKSNIAATKTRYTAQISSPLKAKITAITPQRRFSEVIVLGMEFFSFILYRLSFLRISLGIEFL